MIAYIFQKTIWKYKTTSDEYNKIMINKIINKNKNSTIFSLYKKNTSEINYKKSYNYILYNLYQSIKLLINITESISKENVVLKPKILNNFYYKFYRENSENQNKITVKRKTKNPRNENKINELRLDNSLSSIKKTIDLDEKDNIQKGCLDFATGNEMLLLLKNFQNNANDCFYTNYYRNCKIYKKKKSPQVSFRVFSPKNKYFFRNNEFCENQNKNNMINNNIFINNNNYNNNTNYIINDYKDINCNEKNLRIEKKYNHFNNFKSQTQTNILSTRFTYRNRYSLPLSQSCEKFIYTKKYISSKLKQKKIGNKTSEEKEQELEDKDINKENNIINDDNIKVKYIPFINKSSKIKIIENNKKNEDIKIVKIEKLNYIGRNNNKKNSAKNKFPFLLSRITKNNKSNRTPNLTQDQYSTKFNSTFNMNYFSNIKTNQLKIEKSKIEKSHSNYFDINYNNLKYKKNNANKTTNIENKKHKKIIERKDKNLKIKKNNTSINNFKINNKTNTLRLNLFNISKTMKKGKKLEKEKKIQKKKKEEKNKQKNYINLNRFNSPELIREKLGHKSSTDYFTSKNTNKKISYKNLINQRTSSDFLNINRSNTNLCLNLNNTTKLKKKDLLSSKSNGSINTISKQLFSPIKRELKIKSFINNDNFLYHSNIDINNIINNNENNNTCFNTLPNNSIYKEKEELKKATISPLKKEKDFLILGKYSLKNNKKDQSPIKVNLNKNCFNESSQNKKFLSKKGKILNKAESFNSNKGFYYATSRGIKKKEIKKNSIKPIKSIKIELNN